MYNEGLVDAELVPQGTLAERIRIAAAASAASSRPPRWVPNWPRGRSTARSTDGPTCWSIPSTPTTRWCGPGRPTSSGTCSSGCRSATSTRSWPWPPRRPSLRSRTTSLRSERSIRTMCTSPGYTLTA
ncbi:hypothetical protein GBAR_LOCUS9382 [Geodia barretti]|uniref:Uncharacterized protein n=2 Tax=Geodia barretti TaxID=519541 RepID=A0AA35RP00_GEOBA|nr:hypothetical protein GBAR_LOCUS9382 [Geodia barretti]